ncbi:MAG: hypothetical protein IV104_13360 [Acidovorax sp.]|nr:hypothetical protein [Acidovorax sp.]
MCDESCSWQGPTRGKEREALLVEHAQALDFLGGLHPCLTIDGPPMAVAERIFDAVMGERAELKAEIKRQEQALDLLRGALARTRLGTNPPPGPNVPKPEA